MAYSDFRDKMKLKSAEAKLKYEENSGEAWEQIRGFLTDPTHWIVAGIVVLLAVAGIFAIKFLGAVRAPEINPEPDPVVIGEPVETETGEEWEEIDDSNTVQPLLSGARKENFYTFLLFGTDKFSGSTDTIMVVSYDVANQKLNLMSIPRDTMVNVSWDIKKINSVYSMGGIKALQKHISKLVGFTPDYYVKIDLQAFVDVVNLLGGVEFDVPIAMHYHDPAQELSIDLEPGVQTLNGEQAMGLVRFRKSDRSANGRISGYDDTGRVATQQAFLKAMFKQCLQIKNWTKITGYVEIFEKNVESDLELGNMLWFARQAMNLSEDSFQTMTAPGNYYASAWSRSTHQMQSYVTLYANQMISVVNESFNPYDTKVSMANLDIMSINSDGSISSSSGYVADGRAETPPKTEEPTEEPDEADVPETTGNTPESPPQNPTAENPSQNPTAQNPPQNPTAQNPVENPPAETPEEPTETAEPTAETPINETPAEEPTEPPAGEPAAQETTDTTPTEETSGAE